MQHVVYIQTHSVLSYMPRISCINKYRILKGFHEGNNRPTSRRARTKNTSNELAYRRDIREVIVIGHIVSKRFGREETCAAHSPSPEVLDVAECILFLALARQRDACIDSLSFSTSTSLETLKSFFSASAQAEGDKARTARVERQATRLCLRATRVLV